VGISCGSPGCAFEWSSHGKQRPSFSGAAPLFNGHRDEGHPNSKTIPTEVRLRCARTGYGDLVLKWRSNSASRAYRDSPARNCTTACSKRLGTQLRSSGPQSLRLFHRNARWTYGMPPHWRRRLGPFERVHGPCLPGEKSRSRGKLIAFPEGTAKKSAGFGWRKRPSQSGWEINSILLASAEAS